MIDQLDRSLAIARWFLPLAIIVLPPIVVRVMYALGWTGLDQFHKRSGVMIDRDVLATVKHQRDAVPVRILRQLVTDLTAPLTLAITSWIAITIVLAVRIDNRTMLLVGCGLAVGYLGLMIGAVIKQTAYDLDDTFEGSLVSMGGPMFGGWASAKVRLDDGSVVQTGVRWRPLATMRHKNDAFRLVFCGVKKSPRFVGFRRTG